jgi:undecaprenyl-diphosphatase
LPNGPWHVVLAGVGYGLAILIAILVHAGALAGVDATAMEAKGAVANPFLDALGAVTGVLVSAEFSLAYGLLGALFLWRAGLGLWSLAPLAFVLIVPAEVALKLTVDQPQVPSQFHNSFSYPLTHVDLPGAFPSGHAARTAFFGVFLAVLTYAGTRGGTRLLALVPLLLAGLVGYTRTYVGDHWLSDVVAGMLVGGATALLVSVPVARRLFSARR